MSDDENICASWPRCSECAGKATNEVKACKHCGGHGWEPVILDEDEAKQLREQLRKMLNNNQAESP